MGAVRVELVNGRIWLKAAFADAGPELSKQIPGASWRGEDKVWTYPLNLYVCRDLRKIFGDKLVIGPALTRWARAEVAHEEGMSELGRQMDAELQAVPSISPRLAKAMASRTYQRSGARFVANGRRVLLADEPSLGKTATALAGLMEAHVWEGSHLVIAPKTSLEPTWGRQIRLWTDADVFVMPEGKAARRKVLDDFLAAESLAKFLVVNPEMARILTGIWCEECKGWIDKKVRSNNDPEHYYFRHKEKKVDKKFDWPEIVNHPWTSAIVDECHSHFANWRPSDINQTREGLSRIQPEVRIALTGTPLRGHEKKLWGTLQWLDAVRGGYWAWIETWMDVSKDGYGWEILGLKEDRREEFHAQIDTVTRRLTKKEARPDLPDKEYVPVWLPLTKTHRKQYLEFLEHGEVDLGGAVMEATGVLAEFTRQKQMAFGTWDVIDERLQPTGVSPKIEWLLQALAERGVTGSSKTDFTPEEGLGYKYVIASQFTQVVDAVEEALNKTGIKTLKITGTVTGKRRDHAVETFQSDDQEYRVMVINTKAGGVSIDLDAWCDEMFILDETWIADDQTQLEGRIDNRSGRSAPRTFYYLRTEETVEAYIAENNLSQDEMQKQLLDSRRGVEVAIRIIRKLKESLRK